MSDKEFIKIQNVSKNFEDVVAVDNISVEIARGEFFYPKVYPNFLTNKIA